MAYSAVLRNPERRDWFMVFLASFVGVLSLDIVALFVGQALRLEGLMRAALAVFVCVQVGMTIACLASFPASLIGGIISASRGRKTPES